MGGSRTQVVRLGCFVCLSVLCGLYLDHLSYKLASRNWDLSRLNSSTSASDALRVLVVSDPQLVGDLDEFWLVGPITRMDCDWYLYNGYQEALQRSQPDTVLFLGDLLDEGSKASEVQFESYVRRFKAIFQTPAHIKQVFIPGDNDIGGEGWERIEEWMLERFYKHFPSQLVTTEKFVDFVTIKDFGTSIYEVDIREKEIASLSHQRIRIFISHLGLLDHYHYLDQKAQSIDPSLILSGHEHWASYISCFKCWKGRNSRRLRHLIEQEPLKANILDKSLIYQITSPTSSYRMGISYPGYGLLDLDSTGSMKYRVLWLPSRYPLLYTYLAYALVLATFITMRVAIAIFGIKRHTSKKR